MNSLLSALNEIKIDLISLDLLPKEIELCRFSSFYFSNIKMKEFEGTISDSVVCGFDENPEIALLKSFSEYIEILSFKNGFKNNLSSCMTDRSDGFSAFPKFNQEYLQEARQRALAEAFERYVWANWWDQSQNGFNLSEVKFGEKDTTKESTLLKKLSQIIEIDKVFCITPYFHPFKNFKIQIYFAFLKNGGVISGGACGNSDLISFRAISELIRHGLAAHRFKTTKILPISFYEKRLCFFLKPEGELLVHERLSQQGQEIPNRPILNIDCEIPSVAPNSFYVHRCLFKNQPPFIGGAIERFCL